MKVLIKRPKLCDTKREAVLHNKSRGRFSNHKKTAAFGILEWRDPIIQKGKKVLYFVMINNHIGFYLDKMSSILSKWSYLGKMDLFGQIRMYLANVFHHKG